MERGTTVFLRFVYIAAEQRCQLQRLESVLFTAKILVGAEPSSDHQPGNLLGRLQLRITAPFYERPHNTYIGGSRRQHVRRDADKAQLRMIIADRAGDGRVII